MIKRTSIIIILLNILNFNGIAQDQPVELDSSARAILNNWKNFMNRPIYDELTIQILDTIPDDQLEQTIIDNIIEQIDNDYEREFEIITDMSKGQQAMYSTWIAEAEVSNGGYNQFYFNSSGQFAEIAYQGFELFGALKFANLMRRAYKIYQENRERLEEFGDGTMESFSESYKDNPLNALDEEFYELYSTEPLNQLRIAYIRKHPTEFTQK